MRASWLGALLPLLAVWRQKHGAQRTLPHGAASRRSIPVRAGAYLNVLFVPKVVALFRERAPNAQLVFHPLGDGFDDERALADGELDVVIDNRPARLSRFRQDDLFDDRVVCLMRATHPLARRGAMTAAEFARAAQLCPTPSWLEASGAIDRQLERVGLQRRIVVTLPHFELAAYALVRSDLILTTTYRLARHYAKLLPLGAVALPAEPPDIVYRMTWNESGACVDGVRWLRGLIAEATRGWLDAEAAPPAVAAVTANADARAKVPIADAPPEPTRRTRRRQATHCGASQRPRVARAARVHRLATKSR